MQVGVSTWFPDSRPASLFFQADFTTGTLPAGVTFARASPANYWNSAGVRTAATANTPRFEYDPQSLAMRGLLPEESRTNVLLNSLVPATQSPTLSVGTYVLWMEGSGTVTSSAGTAVGSGFGVATNATGLGTYGTYNTIIVTTAGTVTFTVSGTVTAFQCELGTYPTSMITTAGAAATRAAEFTSMPASAIGFNASEGTLIVEAMALTTTQGNRTIVNLSDGSTSNLYSHLYMQSANTNRFVNRVGTTDGQLDFTPSASAGVVFKQAAAYKLNDFAGSLNGATVVTDTLASIVPGINLVSFGQRANFDQFFNGYIRKVIYYPTRLPNAQLQALAN